LPRDTIAQFPVTRHRDDNAGLHRVFVNVVPAAVTGKLPTFPSQLGDNLGPICFDAQDVRRILCAYIGASCSRIKAQVHHNFV